jgi:putative ABC transport system permease protein
MLQDIIKALRYGARTFFRNPGFTAVALITLGLGIGATTAMFSVVDAVLLRSLPYHDPPRLVAIYDDRSRAGFPRTDFSPANYQDCRTQNHVFEGVAAIDENTFNLTGTTGDPRKLTGIMSTWDLFPLLGVQPLVGRTFSQEEDRPGNERVVLISYRLWLGRFAADPGIVGRGILLNDRKYTVIGVMPLGFAFPDAGDDLWMPRAFTPEALASRNEHYLMVIARLKRGVSLTLANADLKVLANQLARRYPEAMRFDSRFFAEPLQERYTRESRRGLLLLLGAVGFILLIACANIANLLLSKSASRRHEIALRRALGADRTRIVRQLLTESALLAVGGGCLGILLAECCFRFLNHLIPEDLARTVSLSLNFTVLGFALALSLTSTFLFGLVPALQISTADLSSALKEGRGSAGSRLRNTGSFLFSGEVALALVLLVASTLLIRSLVGLRSMDPGFRPDHVLTMVVPLRSVRYSEFARRAQFFDDVLARVKTLPGVKSAGFTSVLPFGWKGGGMGGFVPGGIVLRPDISYTASNRVVTPGYFETMRIPLRRGRLFDEHDDRPDAPAVAIVNETMARRFWPGQDALGKRIRYATTDRGAPWARIVGVVGDMRQMGLNEPPLEEMYFPHWQAIGNYMLPYGLAVRCDRDPLQLAHAITRAVHSVDPDQPVSAVMTLDDILDQELAQRRVQTVLLGGLAALALILASVGIYGVMAHLVSQRKREIGIRMAIGARRIDVLALVLRRGMVLAVAGIAAGILLAIAFTRLMAGLLVGVSPTDPWILAGMSLLLLTVALAACLIPARRAASIDPIQTLRAEDL